MLKIIYHNCYGIDIHKTFVISVAAIINDHNVTQYYRRRFSISTKALLEFYFCFNICMESTDKYLIPVFNVLERFRSICLVFSPKKIYQGNRKNNKKDVKWITDLFKHNLVIYSFFHR